MLEALLGKIALSVFAKAVLAPAVGKALKVYSIFELCAHLGHCIQTTSNCDALSVCEVKVLSTELPAHAVDHLLSLGDHEFRATRTQGGIYVASALTPGFVATPRDFPRFASTPKDFPRLRKLDE